MSKDKYSDNHTIMINKGSGTLTVDGNLSVNGAISSSGSSNLGLSGEDIAISASRNITIAGGSTDNAANVVISSGAGFADKGSQIELSSSANNVVIKAGIVSPITFPTPTDGISIAAKGDVRLYGGAGNSNGAVYISADNGYKPYITLTESPSKAISTESDQLYINSYSANINAYNLNMPSTGTVFIGSEDCSSVTLRANTVSLIQDTKTVNLIVPASSFVASNDYGIPTDANKTTELESGESISRDSYGSIKWLSNRSPEDVCKLYILAPLPDSIPNGAVITRLGYTLYRDTGLAARSVSVALFRRTHSSHAIYKTYAQNSDDPPGTLFSPAYDQNYNQQDGPLQSSTTINRSSYSYSIVIVLYLTHTSGNDEINVFEGAKITYTTTKYDTNI